MPAGSKVSKLPVKRVRPAPKPAPARRKAAAKKTAAKVVNKPAKTTGFAVGVSALHYAWIDATANALGKSKQAVVDGLIGKLLQRATLGSSPKRRRS